MKKDFSPMDSELTEVWPTIELIVSLVEKRERQKGYKVMSLSCLKKSFKKLKLYNINV